MGGLNFGDRILHGLAAGLFRNGEPGGNSNRNERSTMVNMSLWPSFEGFKTEHIFSNVGLIPLRFVRNTFNKKLIILKPFLGFSKND